jgi:hypothetical protein
MRRIFLWWMTVNELTYHCFKMYAIFAFFLFCFIRGHTLLHICSLYRGFLYYKVKKKCSLLRVGRCSLYRDLFTAKLHVGGRTRTCVQRRGIHFTEMLVLLYTMYMRENINLSFYFYCISSTTKYFSWTWSNSAIK